MTERFLPARRPGQLTAAALITALAAVLIALAPTPGLQAQEAFEPVAADERRAPVAEEIQASALRPQEYRGIRYLSGGVGSAERAWVESQLSGYRLRVDCARGSGEYLGAVWIEILDAQGVNVFQAHTDGPVLLVQLDPGAYTVRALHGDVLRQQRVTLRPGADARSQRTVLTWP